MDAMMVAADVDSDPPSNSHSGCNDVRLTINALQAFENTSTNIAAAQMRNALTNLAETVKDPEQKKASRTETQARMGAV
jgi:hypothetical protein